MSQWKTVSYTKQKREEILNLAFSEETIFIRNCVGIPPSAYQGPTCISAFPSSAQTPCSWLVGISCVFQVLQYVPSLARGTQPSPHPCPSRHSSMCHFLRKNQVSQALHPVWLFQKEYYNQRPWQRNMLVFIHSCIGSKKCKSALHVPGTILGTRLPVVTQTER